MLCKKSFGLILINICTLIFTISAQQKMTNYDNLWKKVDSLNLKKGLTKSALEQVNNIYTLAKKEKQDAQAIKALLYKLSLESNIEEASDNKSFEAIDNEIKASNGASKYILYSILAEKYRNYFQQNSWQLYNRTETINFKKEDIATWAVADFHNKISELYLASVKDEKLLQQTSLETYDPLIVKGNSRYLRPTLFDLLVNRALEYFKSPERDISKPAYAFEIKDPAYFNPAADFVQLKITTKDAHSLYHKALLLYQQLLAFHLSDPKPAALVDADIQRIQFVYQYGVMPDKDSLYLQALTDMSNRYPAIPAASQAAYLRAQWYAGKAATYAPFKYDDNDPANPRNNYITALEICKAVLAKNDSSEGYTNCFNLQQQIEKKALKLNTEKVNIPVQAFRTLVSYRNTDQLYLRIIPITEEIKKIVANRYEDKYWAQLTRLSFIKNWNQALPASNDYQQHSAEIKIDALPVGEYLLLASLKEDFSLDKNPLAVQHFYVSNISYISKQNEYFVVNRETGKPLAATNIQAWWSEYDYNARNYKKTKGALLQTDKNGYAKFPPKLKNRDGNMQLEFTHNNDRLFLDDNDYIYERAEDENKAAITAAQYEKDNAKVYLFTDRSIYRPGQTVYFKGIAITKDFITKKSKIYAGVKTTVSLQNANEETVDSLPLTSSDYGSYSGTFKLPENGLNGSFSLVDELLDGHVEFSVEEYKRPKFYVEYEPVKGSYKVNDSIQVTGFAKAFAGNNVDGAQVKYRVQRVARFMYPWRYWRWGYPQSANMEITNGTTVTDEKGAFHIRFDALPDASVNKDFDPIFDFRVSAEITDINGETRTGETTVAVAYKSLQLLVQMPEMLSKDSLKTISIRTQNLNGQFEPAQISVKIFNLQVPERLIRSRYWQRPDMFTMTKETFIQQFPNDEYETESDYRSWARDKIFLRKIDSSYASGIFELPPSKLPQGWYAIEVSTRDKEGEEITDVKYIQLYDEKAANIPSDAYTWQTETYQTTVPGNKATVQIGTAAKDLYIIQQTEKRTADDIDNTSTYQFITLNNEKRSLEFPVTESDRGGFGVYHFFIKNNRFYSFSNNLYVPWDNQALSIAYESFRDKTLPGAEEKWKLKISGYKKEKLAAEMLAAMYDASLDEFKPHSWELPNIWPTYYKNESWQAKSGFMGVESQGKYYAELYKSFAKTYDRFNSIAEQAPGGGRGVMRSMAMSASAPSADKALDEVVVTALANQTKKSYTMSVSRISEAKFSPPKIVPEENNLNNTGDKDVQIRKNFNETAFFLPNLQTDSAGNISFGCTMPEALTKWKFMAFAHTKDLAFGYSSNTLVTQKQLMVQPNAPRFLREGDKIELSTKIVNLTDKEVTGTVQLDLSNTVSGESVSGWFHNMYPNQYFTAAAGQSTVVKFVLDVPYQYNSAVTYRFVAKAGDNSDGEEAAIPVLTNSMLVTESMPLPIRGNAPKNFRFEKLIQSGNSETLQQHALTVEFTSNPAWYAVQALPYLMEYPYECAEQTFNRYYANAIASSIANATPKLKAVFDQWASQKDANKEALMSNLQKNQELKAVLLEETPWVMEAKNEAQQKKNIALLFDMLRMSKEQNTALEKLKQLQGGNGGFVWFKGGPDDRYITQYILAGLGHLRKLNALNNNQQQQWNGIVKNAVQYLDQRIKEDYDYLIKHKADLKKDQLNYTAIQYLYMRSFFNEYNIPGPVFTAVNFYRKQAQQYWLSQGKYMQGMIALALSRTGDIKTANDILKSLKQNAIVNEELGMYWKDNTGGYYWQQAPIETQSLLIEAFAEISKDTKTVDDLKTWLLKQKQTSNWQTTKATAEACYALLLQGSNWLSNTPEVEIKLGNKTLGSTKGNAAAEAGTGYFKQTIEGAFVNPAMGEITVKIANPVIPASTQPSWGAVYWQYFEQLDKITPSATPLKINKQLFVERLTDNGLVLDPLLENAYLKVGDRIKVRIELRVDRDMEYIHMKDMRASCMESVNVLSSYKWQGGLGYYESTKDASTNFFFNQLPKGTWVFEYPLFVTHTGNFSNGITTIQCMYAPEFSSHSEGVRVNVEDNK
jgi:hypothetical protein